jgi:RimJ/RimL family protein N-acetyltransferase
MNVTVAQLTESHFEQLRAVLDTVARERRYLALFEAPPSQEAFAFYRRLLAEGQCHVALEGIAVVGWCDIQPAFGQARKHIGTLGMGLLPAFRRRGIGAELLSAAVTTAWARGLTRIELTVREDNANAKALYERLGFRSEGINRQSMLVAGQYYDCYSMALLRTHAA